MHFVEKSLTESAAQEWYVLAAYFAIFILLEVRKYGAGMEMHRAARHALWAASAVLLLRSILAAAAIIRSTGLNFVAIDYAPVMILAASLVYFLGCMFEQAPQPAFVHSRRRQ
jgi:hypothetical protein